MELDSSAIREIDYDAERAKLMVRFVTEVPAGRPGRSCGLTAVLLI